MSDTETLGIPLRGANLPPPVSYAQRVWSSGTSVWCYYVGQLTSSPAATQTTPNWVGSAIRHQVLGSV